MVKNDNLKRSYPNLHLLTHSSPSTLIATTKLWLEHWMTVLYLSLCFLGNSCSINSMIISKSLLRLKILLCMGSICKIRTATHSTLVTQFLPKFTRRANLSSGSFVPNSSSVSFIRSLSLSRSSFRVLKTSSAAPWSTSWG